MDFERIMDSIYGARVEARYIDASGRTRVFPVAIRIDGREGTYRVDVRTGLTPWEAVDGGEGFRNLRQAKAHARRYLRAVKAQGTLTPTVDRPDRPQPGSIAAAAMARLGMEAA